MFKLVITFLLALVSVVAHSIGTGQFHGQGQAFYNGRKIKCDFIEIRFIELESQFILRGGGYKCGDIQAEYPYSSFKKMNGRLYFENQFVGTIDQDNVSLFFEEFKLKLNKHGENLSYHEHWKDADDELLIVGTLKAFH